MEMSRVNYTQLMQTQVECLSIQDWRTLVMRAMETEPQFNSIQE
jgi:hypothetical protein